MNQQTTALRNTFIVLFFISFSVAIVGGLFWANLLYLQNTPLSLDFLPVWKGAHNLLVEGLTPYGEFTTYEIQKMVYGRAAGPAEPPLRVDMPLPLLLLFLPFGAFGDMELARAAWMVVLELGLFLLVVFSLRLAGWRVRWYELLLIFLFTVFWAASVQSLLAASTSLILVVMLTGALLALRATLDELAGMLIAFSMFDIESSALMLLFLLTWVFLNGRWRTLAGLLMTLILLTTAAFIVNPNWFLPYIRAVIINWNSGDSLSTFTLFASWFPGLGEQIAWGLAFVILLLLMFESQQAYRRSELQAIWLACLAAAATPLVGLPLLTAGQVFLLPGLLLAASIFSQRWTLIGGWVAFFALFLMFALGWFFTLFSVQSGFLWLSLLTIALLYWVRWWVIRQPRLWADRISASERAGRVSY